MMPTLPTIGGLLEPAVDRLRAAGSESARLDAELLLGWALGIERTGVIARPEAPVGADAAAAFEAAVRRREAGEPVAYIRGFKEFYGLAISVDARALIPRPETEMLVELAEAEVVRRLTTSPRAAGAPPIRVADVGTGSGAVAIALATRFRRHGFSGEVDLLATDAGSEALDLARENAVGHAVGDVIRFAVADLLPDDETRFDLVLANLPYVPSGDVPDLPIAASFEPRLALDGGPDGLEIVRRLLIRLPDVLAAGGIAMLEIGSDHAPGVAAAIAELLPGWRGFVEPDLSGASRIAVVRPPAA